MAAQTVGSDDGADARRTLRGAATDWADRRGVRRQGSAAAARSPRAERLGAGTAAPAALRRTGPARRRLARSVRRPSPRQSHVASRQRAARTVRVVLRDLRRAGQPDDPAARPVWNSGAE